MAGSRRITGGTAALTDALLASLPRDVVRIHHHVTSIKKAEDQSGLLITVARDPEGNLVEFRSKCVVLALPPQVIQATIQFHPALPERVASRMRSIPTWMAGAMAGHQRLANRT